MLPNNMIRGHIHTLENIKLVVFTFLTRMVRQCTVVNVIPNYVILHNLSSKSMFTFSTNNGHLHCKK